AATLTATTNTRRLTTGNPPCAAPPVVRGGAALRPARSADAPAGAAPAGGGAAAGTVRRHLSRPTSVGSATAAPDPATLSTSPRTTRDGDGGADAGPAVGRPGVPGRHRAGVAGGRARNERGGHGGQRTEPEPRWGWAARGAGGGRGGGAR